MIGRKSIHPRFTWGNPWHGRFSGSGLQLTNGTTIAASVPANAPESLLVRFPGLPLPETSAELAQQGGEWLNDALLYTCEKRYSPFSNKGLGYLSWLWRDANGQVWKLRATFNNSSGSVSVGGAGTLGIAIYARKFGVFGIGSQPEYLLLTTNRAWTNRGPSTNFVIPHLAHSPSGARTAITVRTGGASFTSEPAAGNMTARAALIRASQASMLLELVIVGLTGSGRPSVVLNTVVDSTASRVIETSTTAAGLIGATSISRPSAAETVGDPTFRAGYSIYAAGQGAVPSSSSNTTDTQLMCGAYQGETLVPVWYRKTEVNVSLYQASEAFEVQMDWQYSHPVGQSGYQYATNPLRTTDGWDYQSDHGRDITTRHAVLLGASEMLAHERRTYDLETYRFQVPAGSNTAAPEDTGWFDARVSMMTTTRTSVHQVWINGVMVKEGSPAVNLDPVRGTWTTAVPAILSNNVFALCPVGSQRYLEGLLNADGGTQAVEPPVPVGAYGELACPSFNPRTGEMSLVVDGINGYI